MQPERPECSTAREIHRIPPKPLKAILKVVNRKANQNKNSEALSTKEEANQNHNSEAKVETDQNHNSEVFSREETNRVSEQITTSVETYANEQRTKDVAREKKRNSDLKDQKKAKRVRFEDDVEKIPTKMQWVVKEGTRTESISDKKSDNPS